MGLDQYLRRIRKIGQKYQDEFKKGTLSYDRYEKLRDVLVFTDADDLSSYDESIHKFFTPCKVIEKYIDMKQAFTDKYGSDIDFDSLHNSGISWGDNTTYTYSDDEYKNRYELVFGEGDDCIDENKYVFDQEDDMYAFSQDREVAYWRKAYHLRHYMKNTFSYDGTNCYYYVVSKEMCEQIIADLKAIKKDLHNKELQDKFNLSAKELQEYGTEYIIRNIDYTIEKFEEAIATTDFDNEVLCYYEWY